ncbi:MAG TPA: hypothetical protein VN848_08250 [Gemmatimonadales bacterium]|nr:hypothetical protein [Gemmatimonadales bacterium]
MTRFFMAKAWLSGAGVSIGLAGILLELRPLVWLAVALLATAFLLRFAERAHD